MVVLTCSVHMMLHFEYTAPFQNKVNNVLNLHPKEVEE